MDEKAILLKVINIIGFEDDKQAFITQFFALIYAEAIAQEVTKLSAEEQENLGKELAAAADEDQQKNIILKYLSQEDFDKRLTDITQEQFTEYLDTIYPTLEESKQVELTIFLNSLKDNNSS